MWLQLIHLLQGVWFAYTWPDVCVIDQTILAGVCVPFDQAG